MDPLPPRIILFDGVCAVCNTGMRWLLDHERPGTFHYAPLQGETAAAIRARHPEWPDELDSIVFVEQLPGGGERLSWHTAALLDIAAHLPAPWSWARFLRIVPAPLRDLGYRAFAAIRYRVFGTVDACRIPQAHELAQFLA
jgi:predicted DCC family thiol-disulfide oxidoreductase YuxK